MRRERLRPLADLMVNLVVVLAAARRVSETRVSGHVRRSHRLRKRAPLLIRLNGDDDPRVRITARIRAERGVMSRHRLLVAHAAPDALIYRVIKDGRPHHLPLAVHLRNLDVLPTTGYIAVLKRRRSRQRNQRRAHVIGDNPLRMVLHRRVRMPPKQ